MLARILASLLLATLLFSPALADKVGVLIAYDSIDGHTEQLAQWIAEGATAEPDSEVRVKRVGSVSAEDLLWADAIMVGSPVYNAGVTPAMAKFLAELPFEGNPLKNKVGGAFVSAKGSSAGEETVMMGILHCMLVLQMVPFGGDDWRTGYGVSYILDVSRDPEVLGFTKDKAARFGRRAVLVARATQSLRAPRT